MIKLVTQQIDGQTSKQPINWIGAPKSTHVHPLAWGNNNNLLVTLGQTISQEVLKFPTCATNGPNSQSKALKDPPS